MNTQVAERFFTDFSESIAPTVAYVIYDDLWEMYFEGRGDWFCNLDKAKLFVTVEDAAKALAEYSKGIKCERYSIGIRKVCVDVTRRVVVA